MTSVDRRPGLGGSSEAAGGALGVSDRPFQRRYHNWEGNPATAGQFITAFTNLKEDHHGPEHRHVLRALMAPSDVIDLVRKKDQLSGQLEFALPVKIKGEDFYLIGAGENGENRKTRPFEEIVAETVVYQRPAKNLEEHKEHIRGKGLRVITTIENPKQAESLRTLWGDIFGGWDDPTINEKDVDIDTDKGVLALAKRLERQSQPGFPQNKRTDVITGIVDEEDNVHAVTTGSAMRLQPDYVVWETTEWAADRESPFNGLVAASAALTNAQIIQGYEERGNYTIIAECNTATRAPGVARSAGMRMPEVRIGDYNFPQVVRNNVGVNDGEPADMTMIHEGREFPMRDFGVFQLGPDAIKSLYLPYMELAS